MNIKKMLSILLFFVPTLLGAQSNRLKKLFHHKAFNARTVQLELGNLVMYFDREPTIQSVIKKQTSQEERRVFFLPSTEVTNAEIKAIMAGINKSTGPYSVQLQEITKPHKGLQVTIVFDPAKVGMSYEKFESIGLQKGILFRFYNKELLKKIDMVSKPILQTACRSVVIDCGHGGNDVGAIGCNNITEKDICLPVGLAIADVLRAQGITTHLARESDKTVRLDARTTFANDHNADLFVSIHANMSSRKTVSGIETYFIDPELFCAIESEERFCSCLKRKYTKSKKLAYCVHNSLINTIKQHHDIKDRFIRPAVSNVLVGTVMPSILVEIGFLSHERESRLLAQASYQKQVARGIARGILEYLR